MKKIIIIGATSGIGRGLAEVYSQEDYLIGITGRSLQREQRFQISGPGKQSAETALSKGLTKEYSLDYRAIYACKQPKTMGKKSYIFCYP